jgi:hypothetical protein
MNNAPLPAMCFGLALRAGAKSLRRGGSQDRQGRLRAEEAEEEAEEDTHLLIPFQDGSRSHPLTESTLTAKPTLHC